MTPLPRKRQSALDRILGRLPALDQPTLAILAQRLSSERDLLETVFDTIQEGVLVLDETGVITYSNRAAAAILGLKESDTGKAVFWRFVPELARQLGFRVDTSAPAAPISAPAFATGAFPTLAREIEITYPEPRHVRLQLSRLGGLADDMADASPAKPRLNESTPLHGLPPKLSTSRLVAILSDITAEKTSTEDLIESERINSIFTLAAGVAHEIGNPLNSINIHLQLIRRKLDRLARTKEIEAIGNSIKICTEEIARLDDIVRHFLGAIRPRPPDFQDIHPLNILAEVLSLLRTQYEDLGINVSICTSPDLPIVSGDAGQLKQLFFNLLKNSMEAMDCGGKIEITAESDDEFVTIHVRDTGKGIERDAMTRMFDPFFTTKSGGHGLGMMVVMRILRAHGGDIGVESIPGTGTTVTVHLPQKHRRIRLLSNPAP
ncbi:MAG: PAS domain-containing protein [Puniceicoccales bacterium]|jgi:signal transduction histidine kinase|nr:PAS domain-containing protein [Puniceicoccales bacterium]